MENLPKISVVTPSFNSQHTIRETIESVLNQKYPDFEHFVMDGGSKDDTLAIVREYPHLLVESGKDEGHYHAMNKGIARATGEIVVVLNSDDCYRPGAFDAVGRAFRDHPEWDGLFGDLVYVDGGGREIYRREEVGWDYDIQRYALGYVIHPTFFLRKRVYDSLGAFRHKEFKNAADFELMLRVGRAGCRIGHLRQLLVNYRYHEYGQSADRRITRNMQREADLIREEHGVRVGSAKQKFLRFYYRLKRLGLKMLLRGKFELIPGHWKLKKHMRDKTNFSSNIDLDKLEV